MQTLTIRPSKVQRKDGSLKQQARLVGTTTKFNPEKGSNDTVSVRIDIDDELALALLDAKLAVLASNKETTPEAEAKLYKDVEVFVPEFDDASPAGAPSAV